MNHYCGHTANMPVVASLHVNTMHPVGFLMHPRPTPTTKVRYVAL